MLSLIFIIGYVSFDKINLLQIQVTRGDTLSVLVVRFITALFCSSSKHHLTLFFFVFFCLLLKPHSRSNGGLLRESKLTISSSSSSFAPLNRLSNSRSRRQRANRYNARPSRRQRSLSPDASANSSTHLFILVPVC